MEYSFIIRKAVKKDAPEVMTILKEAFEKYVKDINITGTIAALDESMEDTEEEISRKSVFIALINGVPVGTIRYEINNGTAYITRFGVRPKYHNIGIGKSLMNTIDRQLVKRGVKKACLYTASKYADLMRFYYGRGFYVLKTSNDNGYIRAMLIKEYID